MGKPSSRRADRRKSRKGQDNMYTRRNSRPQAQRAQNTPPPAEAPTRSSKPKQATSSESKLGSHLDMEFDQEDGLSGFRFIDVSLLIEFVSTLLCPTCKRPMGENKRLSHVSESRSSLASKFEFTCQCQMKQSFWTSAKLTKTYEVNRRFAVAMFAIGRNQQQGTRFLGNMNMPASMYKTSWVHHKKAILQATERTAEESTKKAAADLKAAKGDQVTVSCDGTWQRRGFQSKNGVFTLLSADKQNSKVRPYYALLLLVGLCVLTVAISLLYLEDAALTLPHTLPRLQRAADPGLPAPALAHVAEPKEEGEDGGAGVHRQLWPDHKKNAWGGGRGRGGNGSVEGQDVRVLNSLEIVVHNLSHQHQEGVGQKESERLGVSLRDGAIVIPPHLLSAPSPNASSLAHPRYIVYLCNSNITCCGWGDRQHGILSAYLISVVTNRTFGVDMSSPCPITTLFHPRILDWKVNASQLAGRTSRHIYTVNDRLFRQVMQVIDFDAVYTEDVVYLTTNYDYFYALKSNPHYIQLFRRKMHGKPRPVVFADLWQNIFKLNKRVRRHIDRTLKLARPTPHHKLVCGHVRLGKNPSIPNDSEVRNTLQTIKPLWKFLAHFKDAKKYRIFVPSDSQLVRTKVLDLFPGQAVDVKGDIMHIDKTQVDDACLGFEKVLADQYLLSMCDVLVLTYSVFGKSAAYMRRSNHDLYFMENGTIKPLQLFKEKT